MGRRAAPHNELNETCIFNDEHTELPVTNRKKFRKVSEPMLPINCLR